jgi:hypothetical protein
MENQNKQVSSGKIASLQDLDLLVRNGTSPEKLREELKAQRTWFLDRLEKIDQPVSGREDPGATRVLRVVGGTTLPNCPGHVNEWNLEKLCRLIGRNNRELQMQLFDEWERDGWLCLSFCKAAEAEEVLAILTTSIEFKALRRTDRAAVNELLYDALDILNHTGGEITIARLVATATYLGFRLRIAIATN